MAFDHQKKRASRRVLFTIGLLALVVGLAVFIGGIAGGIPLLQQHKKPELRQGQIAVNQGKFLLYICTATDRIDTLTMVRTSDGQQLWQYHSQGQIATGLFPGDFAAQNGKVVQVVNGVVYFADGTPRIDTTSFTLLALRASDGKPVWQKHLQMGFLSVIGATAHEIFVEVGPDAHKIAAADLSVQAYQTGSGTLEWQRRLTDMEGGGNPFVVGGLLYMFTGSSALSQPSEPILSAFDPTTGQLLWQSRQWGGARLVFAPDPFLSVNGMLVIYSSIGDPFKEPGNVKTSLMSLRESDGTLAWQTTVDPLANDPANGKRLTQSANGILYFPTYGPKNSLDVHALRLADGGMLWKEHISSDKGFSLDLQLADGRLYMHTITLVAALRASDGGLLWQRNMEQPGFSQLAVGNGTNAFLRVGDTLYALRPADGKVLWQYVSAGSDYKLLLADGKVIFSTSMSGIPGSERTVAFQQDKKGLLWSYGLNLYVDAIALGP